MMTSGEIESALASRVRLVLLTVAQAEQIEGAIEASQWARMLPPNTVMLSPTRSVFVGKDTEAASLVQVQVAVSAVTWVIVIVSVVAKASTREQMPFFAMPARSVAPLKVTMTALPSELNIAVAAMGVGGSDALE